MVPIVPSISSKGKELFFRAIQQQKDLWYTLDDLEKEISPSMTLHGLEDLVQQWAEEFSETLPISCEPDLRNLLQESLRESLCADVS